MVETAGLFTVLYSILYLGVFLYVLNWFYQAVKRMQKSLQEIERRLDAIEAVPPGAQGNPPPPPPPPPPHRSQGAGRRERVSNMWGIPAILFIAAVLAGSFGVTEQYLLYGAGVMVVVAAAWEVVRREGLR